MAVIAESAIDAIISDFETRDSTRVELSVGAVSIHSSMIVVTDFRAAAPVACCTSVTASCDRSVLHALHNVLMRTVSS